jgi:flagellar motor switch protein FliG
MDSKSLKIKTEEQQIESLNRVCAYLTDDEATLLKENVLYIENLINISDIMKIEFLRDYDLKELSVGLKLTTASVIEFLTENLSSNLKNEFFRNINQPHRVGDIVRSVKKLNSYIKEKEGTGELCLSKEHNDTYV